MILETGSGTEKDYFDAMQFVIDDGIVWKLNGWYSREAQRAIDLGMCEAA